ncbi:fructose-specific PTS transporter subunit EIIC [Kocuria sp. SM24M-10]|uniref:PTS fructose transporter subunit IIABC n=1 Tax=Kocuria sp. SM24M-10 TaxID=1660349 RepID=UPI00064B261F|nr:fructose-specific PTS transporter subunit EIIC [Kocuria sp. SM24M-10]KLU11053.1 PTS sugar transporter [Kocuria sp. SM24M-10]
MSELITPDLVSLDQDLGGDKETVIGQLAALVQRTGRAEQLDGLLADAIARENKTATGIPGGIAIPHCRSAAVTEPTLVMARLAEGVPWGAKDGPADIVFFIAAPEGADQTHLKLLAKLARSLMKKDFVASLRSARSEQEIVRIVDDALDLSPAPEDGAAATATAGSTAAAAVPASVESRPGTQDAPATAEPTGSAPAPGASARRRIVAVTACPTGIAHTYMAADGLTYAAEGMGVDLQVETQGSAGFTKLDPATIAAADAVIFATDVDVRDRSRFAGKPYVASPVKRGIDEPKVMIEEALANAENPNAKRVQGAAGSADEAEASGGREGWGTRIRKAVMTGVSYMIPFVAAGGLLIALGFMVAGADIANIADDVLTGSTIWSLGEFTLAQYIGAVLFKMGSLAIGLLVPALAGYIAYGLADRPGIAPGFAAGLVANFMGAGFLGGIVGGLLAGLAAYWLAQPRLPRWLGSLMPVVIIPLLATLFSSGLLLLVLGGPIATFMAWLTEWLNGMTGASALALGAILGLMMGADLGGPINKVAYTFAAAGLGAATVANTAPQEIMAAVIAAGMVPPLGLALASLVAKRYFTVAEQENGKAAWLLGASFISEGAIPFAAADPLRVLPSTMVGGAVAGAISLSSGALSPAPHGGVWILPLIGNPLMFLLSVVVGTVVTAGIVVALKHVGGAHGRVADATRSREDAAAVPTTA